MCIVKIVNNPYSHPKDVKNLIHYAVQESHCMCGFYGATGMAVGNVEEMTAAMRQVKKEFQKKEGRQLLHIVVSFDDKNEAWVTPELAYRIGYEFAAEFFDGYQVVFGVHDNEDNLHLHLVLNSVSYQDGLKYGVPQNGPQAMKHMVESIMKNYTH